jgi:hypothetical protein
MRQRWRRHFAFVLLRWLTWLYPHVWNLALSGTFDLLYCPSMSAPASAGC